MNSIFRRQLERIFWIWKHFRSHVHDRDLFVLYIVFIFGKSLHLSVVELIPGKFRNFSAHSWIQKLASFCYVFHWKKSMPLWFLIESTSHVGLYLSKIKFESLRASNKAKYFDFKLWNTNSVEVFVFHFDCNHNRFVLNGLLIFEFETRRFFGNLSSTHNHFDLPKFEN